MRSRAVPGGQARRPSTVLCAVARDGPLTPTVKRSIYEIRICTNNTCRKQGSPQVLKFAQDLGFEELDVQACGCLGNCGNGPNMAVLPQDLVLRHVNTPADFADVVRWQCGLEIKPEVLKATELRLAGNALATSGDIPGAIAKYEAALKANPDRGKHMLYSNLSIAHLQLNHKEQAVELAQQAVACAPRGFHVAHVRLVDALYALGRYEEAAAAVKQAMASHPGFAFVPEYKMIVQALAKVQA